jgi:hypothetical protein
MIAPLVLSAALAAGCKSEPPPVPTGPTPAEVEAARHIQAVEPRDMAQEVSRRPILHWKIPAGLGNVQMMSFALYDLGKVEDPRKDGGEGNQIAFISGLMGGGMVTLDPFAPPGGSVTTGDIRQMRQLAPQVWYRWKVRAISGAQVEQAEFYFKTRIEEAAIPEARTEEIQPPIPMPAPLPPQPLDTAPSAKPK